MTRSYSRRRVLAIGGTTVLAGMAAGLLPRVVAAQGATNATLEYPEFTVTVEDEAIKAPDKVPGGLVFANLKNASKADVGAVVWGRLPDGIGRDAVMTAVAGVNQATPTTMDPVIRIASKMTLVGGPGQANPGQTASGVVRLAEGTYAYIDVFGGRAAFFEVGSAPGDAKTEEPRAEVTVKLGNMVFVGLDQGVPTGKHAWRVENIDKMEHELILVPVEPGTTEEDFKNQLMPEMGDPGGGSGEEPPPSGGDNASAQSGDASDPSGPSGVNGGASILSSGLTSWQLIDLKPGHYGAMCMVPMNWSGPPHAMMGMVKIFEAK